MFRIVDGWLDAVDRRPTKKMSGTIKPRGIVMHYTAGTSFAGDLYTLQESGRKASAHLLIGRKGELSQIVPFTRKAWHAGPSRYEGFRNLNSTFIGIEIENLGYVKQVGHDWYKDFYGNHYSEVDLLRKFNITHLEEQFHPVVGSKVHWLPYSDAQFNLLDELVPCIINEYPAIEHIVSHEEIDTRGWKSDPGPLFPLRKYRNMAENRADVIENEGDTAAKKVYIINVSKLNVRSSPEMGDNIIGSLDKGVFVNLEDRDGAWRLVERWIDGVSYHGWVHGRYIEPV